MTLERSETAHGWTGPSGNFRKSAPLGHLGISPIVGGLALAAVSAALGAWLSGAEEDWSDNQIFADRARQLHSKLLTIQCAVVGANVDIRDMSGNIVCPAGTVSACRPDAVLLGRWRSFLGNFGKFLASAQGRMLGPSEADGVNLKSYTTQAIKFASEFRRICPAVDPRLIDEPPAPSDGILGSMPWGWIIGGGLGVVAVLALLRTPAAPIVINTSEALERGARRAGSAIRRRF